LDFDVILVWLNRFSLSIEREVLGVVLIGILLFEVGLDCILLRFSFDSLVSFVGRTGRRALIS
jgi:hypothetical protein